MFDIPCASARDPGEMLIIFFQGIANEIILAAVFGASLDN